MISVLIVFNSSSAVGGTFGETKLGMYIHSLSLLRDFLLYNALRLSASTPVSFHSFFFFPFKLELASPEGKRLAQLCYPVRLLKPCLDKKLLYAFLTTVHDFHFVRHLF